MDQENIMQTATDNNQIPSPTVSEHIVTPANAVIKSRKRTSFEEFCIVNRLRPEIKAGFRVWLKGNFFHFDDEWTRLYTMYRTRK